MKLHFVMLWEGNYQLSEAAWTEAQRIAMKFGILIIGIEENIVSIDEIALFLHHVGQRNPVKIYGKWTQIICYGYHGMYKYLYVLIH